jgi:hypothetical protein
MSDNASQTNQAASSNGTSGNLIYIPPIQTYNFSIAGGMWLAMATFMNQITAVQSYDSEGLIPLSAGMQNSAETQANYWINMMSGTGSSGWNGQPPTLQNAQYFAANGLPLYYLNPATQMPFNPLHAIPYTNSGYTVGGTVPPDASFTAVGIFSSQQVISWIAANGAQIGVSDGMQSTEMQKATATMNVTNTLYNQSSSFWSGLNNATNQNSSNALQTVQTALQEYAQGPQSLLQTIASVL